MFKKEFFSLLTTWSLLHGSNAGFATNMLLRWRSEDHEKSRQAVSLGIVLCATARHALAMLPLLVGSAVDIEIGSSSISPLAFVLVAAAIVLLLRVRRVVQHWIAASLIDAIADVMLFCGVVLCSCGGTAVLVPAVVALVVLTGSHATRVYGRADDIEASARLPERLMYWLCTGAHVAIALTFAFSPLVSSAGLFLQVLLVAILSSLLTNVQLLIFIESARFWYVIVLVVVLAVADCVVVGLCIVRFVSVSDSAQTSTLSLVLAVLAICLAEAAMILVCRWRDNVADLRRNLPRPKVSVVASIDASEVDSVRDRRAALPYVPPQYLLNKHDIKLVERVAIGRGSFGMVYHCSYREGDVAVKTMNEAAAGAMLDIMQEAAVLWHLVSIPNVVQFFGVLQSFQRSPALVLEFCQESLSALLKREWDQLTIGDRVSLAHDVACALQEVHARDWVHRDIASRNVLIARMTPRTAKLSDFGLAAKCKETECVAYDTGASAVGAFRWIAPEQLGCTGGDGSIQKRHFSQKSDVYQFGGLMFEIFVNFDGPWSDVTEEAVRAAVMRNERPAFVESADKKMQTVQRVMESTWNKDENARPSMKKVRVSLTPSSFRDVPTAATGPTHERNMEPEAETCSTMHEYTGVAPDAVEKNTRLDEPTSTSTAAKKSKKKTKKLVAADNDKSELELDVENSNHDYALAAPDKVAGKQE